MNFINRRVELAQLHKAYQQGDPGSLVILYGRRRLGKTTLLKEFSGRYTIPHCYEKLCRYYIADRSDRFQCLRIGRQWGKRYEIDVAGVNLQNELNVVGECKWSKKPVGLSVLQ